MKFSIPAAWALHIAVAAYGQTGAKTVLEVTSPLGAKFYSIPDDQGVVEAAKKALAADPKNPELFLKLAQAHAAVWQDREAVEASTRGLALAPKNAALLTERGHRQLPLRQFVKARDDLSRAVELEPKRMDAYYHLGLAHYFLGDFALAAQAFRHAVEFAPNDDERINSTNWAYAAVRRANAPDSKHAGEGALAAIPPEMKPTAPHTLHYLNLVRLFQGRATPAEITPPAPPRDGSDTEAELAFDTVSYGIGNWELYNGNAAKAREYFERVLEGKVWITWGFIGAEREIAAAGKQH